MITDTDSPTLTERPAWEHPRFIPTVIGPVIPLFLGIIAMLIYVAITHQHTIARLDIVVADATRPCSAIPINDPYPNICAHVASTTERSKELTQLQASNATLTYLDETAQSGTKTLELLARFTRALPNGVRINSYTTGDNPTVILDSTGPTALLALDRDLRASHFSIASPITNMSGPIETLNATIRVRPL